MRYIHDSRGGDTGRGGQVLLLHLNVLGIMEHLGALKVPTLAPTKRRLTESGPRAPRLITPDPYAGGYAQHQRHEYLQHEYLLMWYTVGESTGVDIVGVVTHARPVQRRLQPFPALHVLVDMATYDTQGWECVDCGEHTDPHHKSVQLISVVVAVEADVRSVPRE